ncbi:hypothetical protein HF086_007554 [Spodoptera exigua]|uniref:Uncharacterized protein n=1 Tax=Spodoptera exigua TaxID=7107 RepID=A0A922SL89_SPOEX|nr:hypothetical protein HF086_007554 [Spodoptera exigua]
MGSTSYVTKPKSTGYRVKSGSSAGSDKEMSAKLKRTKIRRPSKMNEYGLKRIPDYTELAYKEAVSKLRYFLSGNYAPSVRSYGGSASVKNLDESDGDLDKKYTSSYTLAEYKPRPRLTAKYATLYADSLNNYSPPHANTTCKVKEVISENEHLHEAQKNKLISRMFHSYNGSESDDLDELGDSTGLDSDNKTTPLKARRSAKARSTRLEGPNIVFESRIAELEAQLTQAKIDLKKVQEENNENKRKLASGLVDSTCLDGFKRQIDNLQRDKSSLESQISKLKLSLEQRDDDGRYKRGSDAVEHQLREERNNLESELRRLKDELSKERSKVRELAGEGARRVLAERSAAEQRYNAHFDDLQHDLAAQYDNVAKLQIQSLRQRLDRADADLVHSRRENLRLSEQISNLEKENLTPISPEKNKKEKELSTMLETMENKHGSAQCRGRSDEPIRTQRDRSSSRDRETRRSKRRSAKESVSSNNYAPIVVGPLTTNQDLTNIKGEKIYNLPLMIQQPFLREKKEPIKVDISVKLVPKPRKKEKKRRGAHVEEIVVQQADDNRGIKNSFSMEVSDGDIQVLNETVEIIEDNAKASEEVDGKNSHSVEENAQVQEHNDIKTEETIPTEVNNVEVAEILQDTDNEPQENKENQDEITENVNTESELEKESDAIQEKDEQKDEDAA